MVFSLVLYLSLFQCSCAATDEFIDFSVVVVVMVQPEIKYSLPKFGEGFYIFTMRGRYVDPYKRVTSREQIFASDKEENTGTNLLIYFIK